MDTIKWYKPKTQGLFFSVWDHKAECNMKYFIDLVSFKLLTGSDCVLTFYTGAEKREYWYPLEIWEKDLKNLIEISEAEALAELL